VRTEKDRGFGIFVYHRVSRRITALESSIAVDPRVFERQIRRFAKQGNVLSLPTALNMMDSGEPFARDACVLTFDDGYRDNWTMAYPILRAYQVPATFFVVTDCISQKLLKWDDRLYRLLAKAKGKCVVVDIENNGVMVRRVRLDMSRPQGTLVDMLLTELTILADEDREDALAQIARQVGSKRSHSVPERLMLNWEEVGQMAQDPFIAIGSHSVSHVSLGRIPSERVAWQLQESKRQIEQHIDQEVDLFSYPFGQREDIGAETTGFLRSAGYKAAVTYIFGRNYGTTDPYDLRRVRAAGSDGFYTVLIQRLKLSPIGEHLKRSMFFCPRHYPEARAPDTVDSATEKVR